MSDCKFIVIVAMARSGSTELSNRLGNVKGFRDLKEIWMTGKRDPVVCNYTISKPEMMRNPMESLRTFHSHCHPVNRFSIKLLPHSSPSKTPQTRGPLMEPEIRQVILSDEVCPIVLQRDPYHRYCSYLHALESGDWGGHIQNGTRTHPPCHVAKNDSKYENFKRDHDMWYSYLRRTFRTHNKSFLHIDFFHIQHNMSYVSEKICDYTKCCMQN